MDPSWRRYGTGWAAVLLCLWTLGVAGAEPIRVASYNLENYLLEPVGNRPVKPPAARDQVTASLQALRPDIVALQEVGGVPALMELRGRLAREGLSLEHWELVTAHDTNIQVAVLSRFPIVARRPHTRDRYLLEGRRFHVSRGFLEVDIQVNPTYRLTLLTAHLKSKSPVAYADEADMRLEEARLLREKVDARLQADPRVNLVVLGDFNDWKSSPPLRLITAGAAGTPDLTDTRPAERNGDNQPSANPRYDPRSITWTHYFGRDDSYSRIDYILLSPGLVREWVPEQTYVLSVANWGVGSDHRPLVAAFIAQDQ